MKKIQTIVFLALLVFLCQNVSAQDITFADYQREMNAPENKAKVSKIRELKKSISTKKDSIQFLQQELDMKKGILSALEAYSKALIDFENKSAETLLAENSGLLQLDLNLLVYDGMKSLSQECGRYSVHEVMEFRDRLDVLSEIKQVYDEMYALCYDEFNVPEFMRLNDSYSRLTPDSLTPEQKASIDRMKNIMDNSVEAVRELHVMMDDLSYYITKYSNVSQNTAWDMIKGVYDAAVKEHIKLVPSLRKLSDRIYQDLKKNVIAKPDAFTVISVLYDECINNNLIAR